MKYLKKYNESVDDKLLELQEFCNSYLAYLIDDGFNIKCNKGNGFLLINIEKNIKMLSRINSVTELNNNFIKGLFKWDDIKDDFIPFYNILSNKYNILEVSLFCDAISIPWFRQKNPKIVITSDDILEDKINDKIDNIQFFSNKKVVNTTLIHNIIIKI